LGKDMKLIYLEWEDAHARAGWHSESQIEEYWKDERCLVKEVGWVYKENKDYICLVSRNQEWADGEQQYGLLQKIPKTWVRKRRVIKL
jgi:hypothetical protein